METPNCLDYVATELENDDCCSCDVCNDLKQSDVKACTYCTSCTKFLCNDCKEIHGKCPAMKDHELLFAEEMPKPKTDRRPKYRSCTIHTEYHNELFCFDHRTLICSKCCDELHDKCEVQPVQQVSENIDGTDIEKLKANVHELKTDVTSFRTMIADNIIKVEAQRSNMLKDAQAIHGSLIEKINYLYYEIKGEIFKICKEQIINLAGQKARIDAVLSKLDGCINVIEQMTIKNKPESTFLGIQDVVSQSRLFSSFLTDLQKSSKKIDLSLKPSQDTLELLDSNFCFGSVCMTQSNYASVETIPHISFPVVANKPSVKIKTEKKHRHTITRPLETIAEERQETRTCSEQENYSRISLRYSVHVQSDLDMKGCLVNGIVVTDNGKKIITDYNNQNLKLFGPTLKFLSSFSLPCAPRGIACISNIRVVVCGKDRYLLFMNISGDQLTLNRKLRMKYSTHGVTCDEKLYLFRGSNPPSIKKIDETGRSVWTITKDKQGHKLFKSACDITCSTWNEDTRVVATDDQAETVTLIDGETGNILAVRHLKGKEPRSVATDAHGNIYICFAKTHEICVMTRNLTEDHILLSSHQGLSPEPLAIAYDRRSEQIIVSNNLYFHRDTLDIFQKSFYI